MITHEGGPDSIFLSAMVGEIRSRRAVAVVIPELESDGTWNGHVRFMLHGNFESSDPEAPPGWAEVFREAAEGVEETEGVL